MGSVKVEKMKQWGWLLGTPAMLLLLVFLLAGYGNDYNTPSRRSLRSISGGHNGVKIVQTSHTIELDNGLVRLTFSIPSGDVTGIRFGGIDNLLETNNKATNRGYWDLNWKHPGEKTSIFEGILGSEFRVVTAREVQVEVSFTRTYNASLKGVTVPFNMDKRFILQRGCSGFYAYAIFERLEGWPEAEVDQIRMVFKLQQAMFRYMVISDTGQRFMPTAYERGTHGTPLAYWEAVFLN